ncbi:MAG TPA: lipoate--protein ligase family protein [Verrucomicrobiae bacterium]|nr:lipoate--protein ligase family protein [Verrucomicrobiae bacterium]
MIFSLELTFPTPEENLACDEALLDEAESCGGPGVLRFWESDRHFVVLGYANRAAEQVDLEACRAQGVPVLRRCSGGGTVLQGPGCLNYSLVLPIDAAPPLASISGANRFILERLRDAIGAATGLPITIEGHTDLALAGRKFSGNAQRRKRAHLLFHGGFLLDFDLRLLAALLLMPPRQPDYRRGRAHADFLTRLETTREIIHAALRQAWSSSAPSVPPPAKAIARLVSEKYSRAEWNFRS